MPAARKPRTMPSADSKRPKSTKAPANETDMRPRRGPKPRSPVELEAVKVIGMRRGPHRRDQVDDELVADGADRQFVVALARGLAVLSAFRAKDAPLGNRELSERTGMPATTISRVTHTLTKLGYLQFDARRETYDLGGTTLELGHTALARINLRRVALPLMQQLANTVNANVGLGMRDRKTMLYADACEGTGLVGLRLFPGSRIPIASSAMGRAYLAALSEEAREELLVELLPASATERSLIRQGIDEAVRSVAKRGFCASIGEWQPDINGVAVPLVDPARSTIYALNLGGPAYMLPEQAMIEKLGPALVALRDEIARTFRQP